MPYRLVSQLTNGDVLRDGRIVKAISPGVNGFMVEFHNDFSVFMAGERFVHLKCRNCGLPIVRVEDGVYAVCVTRTTADGLTFCPPDPDTMDPVGEHIPKEES